MQIGAFIQTLSRTRLAEHKACAIIPPSLLVQQPAPRHLSMYCMTRGNLAPAVGDGRGHFLASRSEVLGNISGKTSTFKPLSIICRVKHILYAEQSQPSALASAHLGRYTPVSCYGGLERWLYPPYVGTSHPARRVGSH